MHGRADGMPNFLESIVVCHSSHNDSHILLCSVPAAATLDDSFLCTIRYDTMFIFIYCVFGYRDNTAVVMAPKTPLTLRRLKRN